jgi:sugar transferase EpsL
VRLIKRIIDIVCSSLGLLLVLPLLAVAALAIRRTMRAPAVFRQQRAGRGGKPFTLYKLRTMKEVRDRAGNLLPEAQRLTRLGNMLRKSSIDELPQFFNVLRGDMSLVGPRPLYIEYLPRYNAFQRRRLEVQPGITGWAQIRGRNAISWEEKFEFDVWYVDHWGLWLDSRILAATIRKVISSTGIAQENHVTMPEFLGTGATPSELISPKRTLSS